MSEQPFTAPTNRVAIVIVLIAANVLGFVAVDFPISALFELKNLYDIKFQATTLVLTYFTYGGALSLLIVGVLGDLYDRRWTIIGASFFLLLSSAWCANATTLDEMLLGRFAQGLSAGGLTAVVTPMLIPLFSQHQSTRALSLFGGANRLVPIFVAPPIYWIAETFNYNGFFWATALLCLPMLAVALFYLPKENINTPRKGVLPIVGGFFSLLLHRRFMGYALSQALALSSIGLLFYAPHFMGKHLMIGTVRTWYFTIIGLGILLLTANVTGILSKRFSRDQLIGIGARMQVAGVATYLLYILLAPTLMWQGLLLTLAPYWIGLGLRVGAGLIQAVQVVPGAETRASALLILFTTGFTWLSISSIQLGDKQGLGPTTFILFFMTLASWGMLRFIRPSPTP